MIEKKINELLEERFSGYNDVIIPYDENNISVTEAIEKLFEENSIEQYNAESIEVFENPSVTIDTVSVAWIEDGELHTYNFITELL